MNNWLDGFAKLHSFKFIGDKVLFSGKMLESDNYMASVEKGEIAPQLTLNQFVDKENDWNLLEEAEIMAGMMEGTAFDNFNPVVWRFGAKDKDEGIYMALTDSPSGFRFNITDLSSMGLYLSKRVPFPTTGCAHPHREPGTDNSIWFMTRIGLTGKSFIEVQRYKPTDAFKEYEVITTFEPVKTSIVHSFSITEDFIVIFMYPLDADPVDIITHKFHVMEAIAWKENSDTDVYVINRHDGDVRHLTAQPMYSLHHANAYQKNKDEIVVDLTEKDPNALRDYLTVDKIFNPPETTDWKHVKTDEFGRWTINLAKNTVTKSLFVDSTNNTFVNILDFPSINENYRGKPYCYLYGYSIIDYTRTAIVKKDLCNTGLDKVYYRENHYVSELWFFPTPGEGLAEDDGVLFTVSYDGELKKSYIMLMDAVTLEPIATSYLPRRVPWSAHGYLFPEAQF